MAYSTPTTLAEASALLRDAPHRIIAGCTDFFPSLPQGHVPHNVLDLTGLAECQGIARVGAGWRIGAAATWADVVRADLPPAFDALKLAARELGSIQIQNRATVAGNICNASPAADGVPPLLALGAEVGIASHRGTRRMALEDFITDMRRVDPGPDEMLVAVHVPAPPEGARGAFVKLGSRTQLVISIAMVAAVVGMDAGRIGSARVAVGSCSPVAARLPALEAALVGRTREEVAAMTLGSPDHLGPLSPITDVRGSAGYRRDVVGELTRRAVLAACGEE